MADYNNILNALGKTALSPQKQSENFEAYRKLNDEGIYIPELLQKLKQLEERVENIEKPKENPIDAELFSVMEQAVKDDASVMNAKRALQNEKTRIISELCMATPEYRKAFDEYKTAVNAAYISKKESQS